MSQRIKNGDLVLVDWEDACSSGRWMDRERAAKTEALQCQSAGFLVRNDRKIVSVASGRCGDNDTVSDVTTIPRSNVKRIRRLR